MKKILSRIFQYIGTYRYSLLFSVVSAIVNVVCTLSAPLVIGRTIDKMVKTHQVNFPALIQALLVLIIIYLGSNFFLWLLTFLTNRISYKVAGRLRVMLFEKLGTLPLAFYDRNPYGDTLSRFVNDVDTICDGLLQGFMALLSGIATIAGTILFMLYLNPLMAAVTVLTAPAAFLVARFITTRSQQLFSEQAKQLGLLNGYAEEMIAGQKVVKAFHYETRAYQHFAKINEELYRTGVKSQFISSLSNPSTRIVNNIAYTVIGVIGGISAIYGRITVGGISSFLTYITIFAKPFNDITGVFTQMQAAVASAQRVFDILDLEPETPDPQNAIQLKNCSGHVQFKNVSFSYNPGRKLIENLSLDIKPNSRIAIVGQTGAGKTTLVNLLMRFYDIDKGAICVDDMDIRHLSRESLHNNFGMVLQDTWLFNGSIRENIAYAKPQASLDEVVKAAKAVGADGFIRKLYHGYDTVITGDGGHLSQGQKQLLTIARVMLANPPMLILDEATSNIDTYTEMRVQQAFLKLTAGRTSFVIAHRLSTIKNADLILVMDNGHIVENGKHEALLAQGGYYSKLYNSQFMSN